MATCKIKPLSHKLIYQAQAIEAAAWLAGIGKNTVDLRNDLVDYIMELGEETSYSVEEGMPTPLDITKAIQARFNLRHVREISGKTAGLTKYRVTALRKLLSSLRKVRNKRMKKGQIGIFDKQLLNPEVGMLRSEKFGILHKVVHAAKMLSDNIRQWENIYSRSIKKANEDMKDLLDFRFQNVRYNENGKEIASEKGIITLNNSAMDGISWYLSEEWGKLKKGTPLRIYKESKDQYLIGVEPATPGKLITEFEWINKDKVNIPSSALQSRVVDKVMHEFMNDVMHGQIKYVIHKPLPSDKKHPDYKKVKEARRRDKMYEDENELSPEFLFKTAKTKSGKKVSIRYMFVKQENSETYHAYVVSYKIGDGDYIRTDKNPLKAKGMELFDKTFKEGFYKSNSEIFGGPIITTGQRGKRYFIKGTSTRRFVDYELMDGNNTEKDLKIGRMQPPVDLLSERDVKPINKERSNTMKFFELFVKQYRKTFNNVFKKMQTEITKEAVKRKRVHDRIVKKLKSTINPETNKPYTMEEITKFLANLYAVADIESHTWFDKESGALRTPNSLLKMKTENYAPVMWHNKNLHYMIDLKIQQLLDRIEELGDENAETIETLEKALSSMRKIQATTAGLTQEELADGEKVAEIRDAVRNVFTKHRVNWTSYLLRRKDSRVFDDYIAQTFRNLESNRLVTKLLEGVFQAITLQKSIPLDAIPQMVDHVKVAFGNPDTKAGLGPISYSNQQIADLVNKIKLNKGLEWDAATAERLMLRVNALFSARYLGWSGALGNRTQMVNNIIRFGFNTWKKAGKLAGSEEWKDIIDRLGVDNMVSIFNDMMTQGGDIITTDFAFIPGLSDVTSATIGVPVPDPMNTSIILALLKKGRANFKEHSDFRLDWALLHMAKRNAQSQNDSEYAARIEQQLSNMGKTHKLDESEMSAEDLERLKEKRAQYFDILSTTKNENTEKILTARYRKLMGKVSEDKIKAAVAWKLSYWWEGWGEKGFTFTEGEREMRRKTAIMALLDADEAGVLGSGKDRFKSADAVRIARNAVYLTMFGMSPVHLGEAFHGLGRMLFQYKSYPLQQALHDYDIAKAFHEGNKFGEGIPRLVNTLWNGARKAGFKATGKIEKAQTIESDPEAWAFMRFLFTRVMASTIATSIHLMPFIRIFMRGNLGFALRNQIRSMENPTIGIPMRLMAWFILLAMNWDDDKEEEKTKKTILDRLSYLLLPVLITSIYRDWSNITAFGKSLTETDPQNLHL